MRVLIIKICIDIENRFVEFYKEKISFTSIKYLIPILGCIIGMILLCINSKSNTEIIFSVLGGLLFAKALGLFGEVMYFIFEDNRKINQYKKLYENSYKKSLWFGKNKVIFYYEPIFTNQNGNDYSIILNDFPKKHFQPDPLILTNYSNLLYAHRNDVVINYNCIRLDNCEINLLNREIILSTSRAKCFDHLVTNFAMDFRLEKGITIRSIYEYKEHLIPLKDSKMANVIGVNALVFLNDGTLLMPLRGTGATISKHMVTSSIAQGCFWEENSRKITKNELIYDFIKHGIKERLFLLESVLNSSDIQVDFLGFGRVAAWGGKPQLYYIVKIDLNAKEYIEKSLIFEKKEDDIDKDREILLVKTFEIVNNTSFLKMSCINKKYLLRYGKVKIYSKICEAECSFFCNCYHFYKYYERDTTINNWLLYKIMGVR